MFKLYCLIKKEFFEEISYRLNFLLRIFSLLLFALVFYFIATIFTGAASPHLARYNGDYFSFVLIGLAFAGFFTTGLSTFSSEIRSEQMLGTLEILLTTRTPLSFILFARLVWHFIYDSFDLVIYFLAGVLLLKAKFTAATLYLLPLVMLLTMLSYSSLGLISASFILTLKRGDPINYFFGLANQFLGGVFFPITVLPAALQTVSAFLPITYSLRLAREVLINGATISHLAGDLLILLGLSAALLPVSLLAFSLALRRARRDGSLTHY